MARKVTINMVAERAGVSRGTVDRVLNQRPHVKPELYDRIVKAMKELGYMPPKEEQAKALGLPMATETGGTLGIGVDSLRVKSCAAFGMQKHCSVIFLSMY